MKRRTLALIALTTAGLATLSACDSSAPDLTVHFERNADGTTTVSGLAADRDNPDVKLLVQVKVNGDVVASTGANLDAAPWVVSKFYACGNRDKDGRQAECSLDFPLGPNHGFRATFTNPSDPTAQVCIKPHGVAAPPGKNEKQADVVEHTEKCFTAAQIDEMTRPPAASTTAPATTTTTTAGTTTTVAPTTTTTTTAATTTTSTTVPAPTTTAPGPGPGPGPGMCPDPMDPSGGPVPC